MFVAMKIKFYIISQLQKRMFYKTFIMKMKKIQFRANHIGMLLLLFFLPIMAFAQSTISGLVKDQTGDPVPGANVFVKGTTNGTITDIDGKYSLTAPSDATLVFSFIGYTSQEVAVGGRTTINVTLEDEAMELGEIVAVGYGTMKKSDLTGSVASVAEADLKNRSTSDAAAALQGKAAGVQVLTNSGAPGTGAEIRVRGVSSNSGNLSPLLIVDGLKVDNIQYLDPEMIESMEILKDAASAAIYGAQAGNGVVLITTKSGAKAKDGNVFYNGQWQLSSLSRDLDVLDADSYIKFGKEQGWLTDKKLKAAGYNGEKFNWADEVFEPTWNSRHTIGFQGGNDRGSFFVALNTVKNDGIFKGDKDKYTRLSLQANAEYKIKKWLTVGTNNSIEKWKTKSVSQQSDNGSALLAAITSDPLFGPLCKDESELTDKQKDAIEKGIAVLANKDGKYYKVSPISGESQSSNPFIMRDSSEGTSEGISVRGLAYLNFNPIKGLTYTSRFGYRIAQQNNHNYQFPFRANDFVHRETYSLSASANTSYYYQWENFVNYNATFADKHDIGAMVGMSWEAHHSDNVSASTESEDPLKGYDANFLYLNYVKADAPKSFSNAPNDAKNLSYFGRLSYSFDSRYSVQANFRADAFDSSKLPSDARWGKFPSFSAGWTISNESFIQDNIGTDVLSFLKLRGSWGRNGNINVLNGYPYSSIINSNEDFYQYNAQGTPTYTSVPNGLPNPNLHWEESEQIDLGLDARFLGGRLSLGVDWYKKTTKGLLVNVKPVIETGIGTTVINAGDVLNTGIELELGWKDQIGDFNYSVNANMSTLKNELTYLDKTVDYIQGAGLQGSAITTRCSEGEPLWYFYGYKFKEYDKEGNATFEDINGDGVWNSEDMTNIGSGLPKVTYGLTINMEYKGIDLLVFGTGVAGNNILPQAWRVDRPYCNNYAWFYENSCTENNPNAKFPAVTKWTKNVFSSDLTMFKGDYFKIKQIQLGYTLPKEVVGKLFISNLRVFASLENFFTFTKYFGLDPEAASANSSNSLGIDMGTYPTAKQIIFGVNLSF